MNEMLLFDIFYSKIPSKSLKIYSRGEKYNE